VKRSKHFVAAVIATAALTFGAVGSASAGPATDTGKVKQTALYDFLKQSTPDAQKKFGAILDELLDHGAFSEGSLGNEWAPRSDAEKKEFHDLLKQLVRKGYERNLKKTAGFEVAYLREQAAGAAVMVETKAQPKAAREELIEIVLKMRQKDGRWRITDIVTEGVSLVSSYRSQFTKIIKKDGFPALIAKMKDKLAKGDV
jgi:phospholipid transport system substrate-binding protein